MFQFNINPDDPACIQRALNTEWLLTNGLGGYAMGTILGVNTRRYHGLLVAATKPPVGRIVALHSMIEQLVIPREDGSEEVIDLSTQQFGENAMLHPDGWRRLQQFHCDHESAAWSFRVGDGQFRRLLWVSGGRQRIQFSYESQHLPAGARLRVRPFFLSRDFHALNQRDEAHGAAGKPELAIDSVLALDIAHTATRWINNHQTWNNFAYVQDRARGQDWIENNIWSPYYWEFDCASGKPETLSFTAILYSEKKPRPSRHSAPDSVVRTETLARLQSAAARFVVDRWQADVSHSSVIAGYPWFGDWGRDTMISLPGLMLCTKRFDEALSCLLMFARNIKNGLIPNVFDDYGGAAHYNTVDAPLWFIHAVHEYWSATATSRDRKGADEHSLAPRNSPLPDGRGSLSDLLNACREIIAAYRRGTDFDIRMDPADSLISAGDEGSQLTWMDAKRDGVCFTPRHGKPVEINALWHNALCCMAEMTDDSGESEELRRLSRQAAQSFQTKFWWNERDCLHDVLQPAPNDQLRPNQIFAVSLPHSPLTEAQQRAVVKIVNERLLTPYGLRTLDREDPDYRGRYEGSLFERDRAYHNGTVWPWLIGPYCEALLRVEKFSDASMQRVRQVLQPLLNELDAPNGGCVNQLAEVYDGDEPHRPNGCPAQAWSVAEVLRVLTIIDAV